MPAASRVTRAPVAFTSGAAASRYWSASTPVGTSRAHWKPAARHCAAAASATAVLPVPTSPMSKRRMGSGESRSRAMASMARRCAPVSGNPSAPVKRRSTSVSTGRRGARAPPHCASASCRCHTRANASTHASLSASACRASAGGTSKVAPCTARSSGSASGIASRSTIAAGTGSGSGAVRAIASVMARRNVPAGMPRPG
jgi:hypothetical protein